MPEHTDLPCPHTSEPCQRHCPDVACTRDLETFEIRTVDWPDQPTFDDLTRATNG